MFFSPVMAILDTKSKRFCEGAPCILGYIDMTTTLVKEQSGFKLGEIIHREMYINKC